MVSNKSMGIKNNILTKVLLILIINVVIINKLAVYASVEKKNIIILIDNSRSMAQSGIGNLAKIAANMIVDTIDKENVNIGIVTFGSKVTELSSVYKEESTETIKSKIDSITFSEQETNLKDGLSKTLQSIKELKGSKSIIILADGEEYINGGLPSNHEQELNALIDVAKNNDIKVNSVALSKEIEEEYLKRICNTTGGLYKEGENASKLFDALLTIIGQESNFFTISNFTTNTQKTDSIKLSSEIEEVVINIAACDNIKPEIAVNGDGKMISPTKSGSLYYVYRIKNEGLSEINIKALKNTNASVIVQLKSKAKISVMGNENNFISVPMKIPMNFFIEVNTDKNYEGLYIQRDDTRIDPNSDGLFADKIEGTTIGERNIRYIAKDGEGRIISLTEVTVNFNDYPPYNYEIGNDKKSIVSGDIFKIIIVPVNNNSNTVKVSGLGGILVIKQGDKSQEVQLKAVNNTLIGEVKIESVGNLEYYVYIRGTRIDNNRAFDYKLNSQKATVIDKENIVINLEQSDIKKLISNKNSNLILDIGKESVLRNDETINIYSDNKMSCKIGEFTIEKNSTGKIKVNIKPINKTENLQLFFKSESGINATDSIKTGIEVRDRNDIYITWAVILLVVISVVSGIFILIRYFYKKGLALYSEYYLQASIEKEIVYKLTFSPFTQQRIKEAFTIDSPSKSVSFDERNLKVTFTDTPKELIAVITLVSSFEKYPKCIQGFMAKSAREKGNNNIKYNYQPYGIQKDKINNESIDTEMFIEEGMKIEFKNKKGKVIELQF